jgi:hypothetical protein
MNYRYMPYLIRMDRQGNILWEKSMDDYNTKYLQTGIYSGSGDFYITGYHQSGLYFAHIRDNTLSIEKQFEENGNLSIKVTPQPFTDICEITIENAGGQSLLVNIYDALGKKVMKLCDETALSNKKSFLVNGRSLALGAYFVEVKAGKEVIREKIIRTE